MKLSLLLNASLAVLMLRVATNENLVLAQGIEESTEHGNGPFLRRDARDLSSTFKCPPEVEYKKKWPWSKPTADTSKLDSYNLLMGLYDRSKADAEKAVVMMLANKNGVIPGLNVQQVVDLLKSAGDPKTCVRKAFESTACFSIANSNIFNKANAMSLKAIISSAKFVKAVITKDPIGVVSSIKDFIIDVVLPSIKGILDLARINPKEHFMLQCPF
jgi:hypothetical protein